MRASFALTVLAAFLASPAAGAASSVPLEPVEPNTSLQTDRSEAELHAWHQDRKSCSRSSRAVLRACRNEADDDYWVGFGRCLNLADAKEREECLAEVKAARAEKLELCEEQFEARLEACSQVGEAPYDPEIDPDDFLSPEEAARNPNPYFPLVPGTVWKYWDGSENTVVTVTDHTIEILGVECFVVNDVVSEGGTPIEDTEDWYAQDRDGNVWYFGEFVKNYEDGVLANLDGSWTAGVDRGKAGIIMKADPEAGDVYRQEFLLGEVEDLGEVLSTNATEKVPAAACKGTCVKTRDFTPVEPGMDAHKFYAPGVGLILEVFPESGEREELVEFLPAKSLRHAAERGASEPAGPALSDLRIAGSAVTGTREISFELARRADVQVEVFDASGRRMITLAHGARPAGIQTVRWDRSREGQAVPAGVYFVSVRTGDQALARKVVVIAE